MSWIRRTWAHWSLQRRIVTAAALALAVVLGLGVLAFSWALGGIVKQAAIEQAQAQANQVAALVRDGDDSPSSVLREMQATGSQIRILDASGAVISSLGTADDVWRVTLPQLADRQSYTTHTHLTQGDHDYVVVATGATRADQTYTIAVARVMDVELRTIAQATGMVSVGSLALALLLLMAVWAIVGRALAPVERIRRQVSQISQARASGLVTVPEGDDEIARLAETMNAMLERLSRADAASRRFVSDASHELRSPLATLRAQVETAGAMHGVALDLDLVRSEVLRMQALVEDLLALAKADDRGVSLSDDEVDLDDVVDLEVRRLRAVTPRRVRAHIEPALVRGDAARLAQVLRNLTDNAVRHTNSEVAVLMELPNDHQVVVHVDNDGPPIPVEDRDRVFDRFARLDHARARDRGGSGLGLAIARTFAQAHGGTLVTTQSPSGGCRFTLTLPRL